MKINKWEFCVQCGGAVLGQPYSFGGLFACELCIRAYYAGSPEGEVVQELRERAVLASRIIGKKRTIHDVGEDLNTDKRAENV